MPRQGYGRLPVPQQGYSTDPAPRQNSGAGPVLPEGYSGNPVPHQGYSTNTAPRQGRRRHAAGGSDEPAGQPAGSRPSAPAPRRGPAHGYPPRPGEPGPQYPQGQFAAWNEAQAAPSASAQPMPAMASAPTWADTGDADVPAADGGGVALAERPGGRGEYALRERRGFGEATALVTEVPVLGTPERGRTMERERGRTAEPDAWATESVSTARRSRAAAAQERNAARRKGRKRRRLVLAGVCVPAVAAVAVLGYLRYPGAKAAGNELSSIVPPTAAASAKSSPKSLGQWQHIGTRAQDPTPLALSQLFPAQFPADGTDFVRTTQTASSNCAKAAFGKQLQSAVRNHSCSQVMRASYLSTKRKLMGTIGVLNLGTSAGASTVGKVTGSGEFIAQLSAHRGPTHNLAKGTGLEEAEVKGHYLIMTWVEFSTLHAPKTTAQKTQLRTFSSDLINQTANVSLTSRMVTGSPQMP